MVNLVDIFEMADKAFGEDDTIKKNDSKKVDKSTGADSENASTKVEKNSERKAPQATLESENKKLEEELKNFIKIEVKAFGGQIMVIEGEEINNINLNTIQSRLVSMGYGEFAQEVIWQIVPNEDKTEAILVAGCKFYAKG